MHDRRIFGGAMASVVLLSAFLPALAMALPHPHADPSSESNWRPSPVYKPQAVAAVGSGVEAGVGSGPVAGAGPAESAAVAQPRKFNEKPNNPKKVPFENNEIDDIQTNQMTDGFWWSNVLSTFIQMFFNGGNPAGPSKSEGLDDDNMGAPTSPWAQVLQVGLKILSHFLGGGNAGGGGDGIDKVDNSSPMQGLLAAVLSAVLGSKDPDQVATMAKQAGEFINIVVNLLDALKTSFSHRSLSARNLGKKDTVSEAAVAGISLLKSASQTKPVTASIPKNNSWPQPVPRATDQLREILPTADLLLSALAEGYVRTYKTSDELCMQKYLCEANRECFSQQEGPSAIYCQLGSYAASVLLQRSTATPFDLYYEAGRRGRSGQDCQQIYLACNQV